MKGKVASQQRELCFWIGRTENVEMAILRKLIHTFNSVPINTT